MNISNYYRNSLGMYQQQNIMNQKPESQNLKEVGIDGGIKKEEAADHDANSEMQPSQNISKDPILKLYQEISSQFPDVSFRLDDQEEAMKYQAINGVNCCPYLGYQNSMNQIGEYFGEKDQKSVELDISVLRMANENPEYRDQLMETLDTEMKKYDEWIMKADEQASSYLCVSLSDVGNGMKAVGSFSNYPFLTEDQLKIMWSQQASVERLMNRGEKMKSILLGDD